MPDYTVEMERAEAKYIAGAEGPLPVFELPGVIEVTEDGIALDAKALDSLAHIGRITNRIDGRVVYIADIPFLVVGETPYEVRASGADVDQ